jgi:hypothetical protein
MLNKRHLKQQAMDFDKIAEKIFKIDPNLRFISVVDRDDKVLLARMREGISAVNVGQRDEDLASIYPPLIMRAVERLQPNLGNARAVSIRYDKILLTLCRVSDLLIIVSFNPAIETPFLTQFEQEIKRIIQAT